MNFLFGSMNDMSFLTILSLISLSVPGLAQTIQAVILKFLYLDVLMTDEWLDQWLVYEEDMIWNNVTADDEEGSDKFMDQGINKYFD
jgi:hypothetical protein